MESESSVVEVMVCPPNGHVPYEIGDLSCILPQSNKQMQKHMKCFTGEFLG